MKKILIISFGEHTGLSIKLKLKDILGNKFEIINLSVDNNSFLNLYTDLVIFSSEEVKNI